MDATRDGRSGRDGDLAARAHRLPAAWPAGRTPLEACAPTRQLNHRPPLETTPTRTLLRWLSTTTTRRALLTRSQVGRSELRAAEQFRLGIPNGPKTYDFPMPPPCPLQLTQWHLAEHAPYAPMAPGWSHAARTSLQSAPPPINRPLRLRPRPQAQKQTQPPAKAQGPDHGPDQRPQT